MPKGISWGADAGAGAGATEGAGGGVVRGLLRVFTATWPDLGVEACGAVEGVEGTDAVFTGAAELPLTGAVAT